MAVRVPVDPDEIEALIRDTGIRILGLSAEQLADPTLDLLRELGFIETNLYWLGRPNLAMASVVAVHTWRIVPLAAVIMMAVSSADPPERVLEVLRALRADHRERVEEFPELAATADTPTARVPGTAADRVAACRRAETADGAANPPKYSGFPKKEWIKLRPPSSVVKSNG